MKPYLNILIVEDSIVFAQGFQLLLEQHPLVKTVCIVDNYRETLDTLKSKTIDIVILDLNFETKEYDGFIIANKIKQLYQTIKIAVLTQHTRKSHYERLFTECKVEAYLDKKLGIEETFSAIDALINGEKYVDKNIQQMLEIECWMKSSKREQEIIVQLKKGLTQKEVADILCISPKTVEVHLRNLFQKFKVKNTTELVVKYMRYINANRENVEESTPPFKLLE